MSRPQRKNKLKVGYILSYKSPSYIRTLVLLSALSKLDFVEVKTAINSSKSVLRYPQSLARLIGLRLSKRPDIYILGFRGHEMYWPVRLITYPKPLIFDEFLNMQDWLVNENKKLSQDSLVAKLAYGYVRSILKSANAVLSDTELGAKSSSQTYAIPLAKYHTVYVGADEKIFHPLSKVKNNNKLEVLFYGNMAPLHGVEYILEAARILKDKPLHFTIIGGKGKPGEIKGIRNYIRSNSLKNITYKEWIDFNSLPHLIAASDVLLGGPFGNTSQSSRVITTKTFQALAMAKATIIGNTKENFGFTDKLNCLVVEQGSAESIAEALSWAIDNRSKLVSIGKQGYKFYNQKFSTDKAAIKLGEILKHYASKTGIS